MTERVPGMGGGPFDSGRLAVPRWTDKSVPATASKLGVLDKPDFDFARLGLLFPQNDPAEKIYVLDQELHEKKLGTGIHPHVHYLQETVEIPVFILEYKYYNNGDDVPGAFTTISTAGGGGPAFAWSGNPMLQIIGFPEIPPPADETISAMLDMILYRDDNVVAGDVLMKFFDYHYQVDGDGSRQPFVK